MLGASLLFASMGVCVKLAAQQYSAGEVVMYRGLVGAVFILAWVRLRGGRLQTQLPAMHFWRSGTGVCALVLWFYAIGKLPLATAMTLNYMSSVWMALFLVGGSIVAGSARVDGRLIAAVLVGFAGVALVLRPTIDQQQLWHGLAGLASGVLAALAYLQVTTLGRAGEPDYRIVFYFSLGSVVVGLVWVVWSGGSPHSGAGVALLLAIGILATTAQLLMTRAYAIGRTLSVAALQYMGIVFAIAYGALLFGDPITPMVVAGILLIVGAGLATTLLRQQGNINPPTIDRA